MPTEYTGGKILWAHPDGYFISQYGQKLKHNFSPGNKRGFTAAHPSSGGNTGGHYPIMRQFGGKACHLLMALAFYGPRPLYRGRNGAPYVGICHHLFNDKLDYRPANLLCWLSREQHREADRRQRALKKVLGDFKSCTYDVMRKLQDPRCISNEGFEKFIDHLNSLLNE